jgi:polar amino acid transport system ATP-binding protein
MASDTQGAMVELRGLEKSFGSYKVLDGISGAVNKGEVIVVCGPSGSGKSTMIRTINRLEEIDGGSILVDSRDIHDKGYDINMLRSKIGFVFQQYNLFPHLSALQNVTLSPIKVAKRPKTEAADLAAHLLEKVGLKDKINAMPANLSGGQQQRVAIARALAQNASVMLLDEPTSALDPEMVGEVLQVIQKLAEEGMTMMVVTHEMGFANRAADLIWFMDQGRIIEKAKPDAFFNNPAHPRLQKFLSDLLH